MAVVGLVVHEDREAAVEQADVLAARLGNEGHEIRRSGDDGFGAGGSAELDLVVSLGGDGSILRAVGLLDGAAVPVLGVNFGHLGYLTAVEPEDAVDAVARTLAGDHGLEERMMLRVELQRADGSSVAVDYALNEVVVERTAASQTVRLGVSLDGDFFTSYAADGMVVATPTGSTAYAFSARGPIVDALHRCIQVTPVSPHMLFDRTLVLNPSSEVCLEVLGERSATGTVDGRVLGDLEPGDRVVCTAADRVAQLVTFGRRDFEQLLKTKFGLEDR
ncbi:MAG TPA: NAD(+)/NADH kinase [Acidimicrobiales bacterium]|jgi:NAD+ kinase|nr:NAD kinase [Actinomycetota bacterium]MDP6062830.1 NAD(+)/NADH kinase [Acidimicrobiales bacterium]HJL89340.1 NAD(+)/NADH kinase [Acidimicrobiales bacterium]HJO98897.1 NAD(+)/NADH kinase [Acidimicrobiales bacterium]|tara:strand:+ start:5919 stop:6746 length:828 start_codon:yes stop_codon:yes gene_type:complete